MLCSCSDKSFNLGLIYCGHLLVTWFKDIKFDNIGVITLKMHMIMAVPGNRYHLWKTESNTALNVISFTIKIVVFVIVIVRGLDTVDLSST